MNPSDGLDDAKRDAITLLADIRRRGGRIWNVGSALHHAAPGGTLDDATQHRLATAKEAVLECLLAEHVGDGREHPLTRTQRRFQVDRPGGTDSGDHVRLVHRLGGQVDLDGLESAFQELVIQQSALRTSFLARGDDFVQRVVPPWRFRLGVRSMPDATLDAVGEEIRRFVDQPFDLAGGHLLRALVIELGAEERILVVVSHQLVVDGSSTSMLMEELGRLHALVTNGRFHERRPDVPRFGDYAREMVDREVSERCRDQIERWRTEIVPGTVASALPTDADRNRDRRVELEAVEGSLEGRLFTRLAERSREWESGSMEILEAVVGCLLGHATGAWRVTTGLSLENRAGVEYERVIGNFTNESLLQVDIDPQRGFAPVLAQVGEAIRRSVERLDTPFEQVLEAVGLERIGRRRLAVPIFLSFRDRRRKHGFSLEGVSVEPVPDHHSNAFQELGIHVVEDAASLQVRIEFDRTVFERERIQSLLDNLVAMLEHVLEAPETPIADLPFDARLARGLGSATGGARRRPHEHVEPATVIETRLAEIWTDLLGVHPVGRFDDFFDLGGSSFLAIRLIERVRLVFGTSLGIEAILRSPTLHELAARIERTGRRLRIERSIRLDRRNDLPKLFCLPGIGGMAAFTFRDIGRHLEGCASLVGLQMKGIDGRDEPDHSIEAIASTMIDEILAIQEQGPFHLCGYSYGGMLAIEIAHRLRASGHEIGNLVVIDTYPPGFVTAQRRLLRRMKEAVEGIRPHGLRMVRDEFDPETPENEPGIERLERAGGLGISIKRTIEATRDAATRYRPRPYPGGVDIVRSVRASELTRAQRRFERLWGRWIRGDLRMHDVPVPHLDLVRSGSESVATVIRGALLRSA